MNCLRSALCLSICLAMPSLLARQAAAQQAVINQVPSLKADALMLFGFYFVWPDDAVAGNVFVIGLLGDAGFGEQDVTRLSKKVGPRTIQVLTFDSAQDIQPCHVLFVANSGMPDSVEKSPQERLAAAVAKVNGRPVLIVAENTGAAKRGAQINFVVNQAKNQVNTEVNEVAIQNPGLGFRRIYLSYRKSGKCILIK